MGSLHFVMVFFLLCCSSCGILHGRVEGYACHEEEREALLSLRKVALSAGADGAWMKWDEQKAECCMWRGVRCDELTGRVITLHLAGCANCDGVVHTGCGALPSSFSRLESLQVLELSRGCFSGAIPALAFPNLTHLDLSFNWFSEAHQLLLAAQVQLLKLTYLNLGHNLIENLNLSLLASSFPNLHYLDLSHNSALGGVIPDHLSSLQHLAYLDLSNTNFCNPVPWQSLGRLSRLRHLGLGSGSSEVLLWEESKPDWPCTWGSLESLSCTNMGFRSSNVSAPLICIDNPALVSKLQHLSFTSSSSDLGPLLHSLSLPSQLTLKSLSLEGSSLGAFQLSQPPSWSKLPHAPSLQTLILARSGLTGIPLWLQQLPLLHSLDISRNNISDFSGLHTFPLLKLLDLSGCNLRELPASVLLRLPRLETLNMAGSSLSGFPSGLDSLVHLRELDMSGNDLNGTLEDHQGLLENCTQLTSLQLSCNHISGVIPQSILKLSRLVFLHLSYNRLSGPIPHAIGNLSLLSELDLSQNLLSGVIPASIGNLHSLSMLKLSANCVSGMIPTSLGNLSLLQNLDLSANNLWGVIQFSVEKWSSLLWLNLSHNNFTGIIPHDYFRDTSSFGHILDLSHNNFTGSLPQIPAYHILDLSYNGFSGSVSLQEVPIFRHCLSLSNNRLSGSLLELFQYSKFFKVLDLSSNNFSGALLQEIGNSSGLAVLNLARNSFTSSLPASLGQLMSLQALILHNNRFSGEIPGALKNCKSLKLLDLSYNQLRGRIPEWITGENFGSLEVLVLSNNQFEGLIPLPLVQNLTKLRILDLASNSLSGCIPSVVDRLQGMAVVQSQNHTVESLQFTIYSTHLYDVEVSVPMKGSQRMVGGFILYTLTTIDLSNNSVEGDVPSQIGALQGLRVLNLSYNKLSGPIPSSLGSLSSSLESLDLSNNQLVGGIPHQLCVLHFLEVFNISSNRLQGEIPQSPCTQISDRDASSFAHNEGLCGSPLPNQCTTAPLVSQEPMMKAPNSPQKYFNILGKIRDHITLKGVGIGYVLGFLMMRLVLYFKHRQQ